MPEPQTDQAARIAELCRDIGDILHAERDGLLALRRNGMMPARIAFHAPCTLQHGLRSASQVEALLRALAFTTVTVIAPVGSCPAPE